MKNLIAALCIVVLISACSLVSTPSMWSEIGSIDPGTTLYIDESTITPSRNNANIYRVTISTNANEHQSINSKNAKSFIAEMFIDCENHLIRPIGLLRYYEKPFGQGELIGMSAFFSNRWISLSNSEEATIFYQKLCEQ